MNETIEKSLKEKRSLVNLNPDVDFTKEPVFFGESLNLERYDKFRYPVYFEFFKKQLNSYWLPEEVDLSKDRLDYKGMSENEKFIFTSNLKYQILLDSVQSRGIPHLTEDLSNPEIEAFCSAWAMFETIHSYSYTFIIKNVYANPSEVFDNILNDEQIVKRTVSVTKYYDDMINSLGESIEDRRKKLYLTLVSINILEGIRFYVSFACSYAFAQNGKMEGNSKIISLINKDENLHLGFTQKLLNDLRNREDEGFQDVVRECEPMVIEMFKNAAEEEMEWAEYLFKDGSMLGLNAEILKRYMKYLTNQRMKVLGLEPIFEKIKNPINWINAWTSSKGTQNAPQQTQIDSYNIGSVKSDLNDSAFDDFDF
jgi:ribonucleoside-diphosphate reductase beta chain